MCGIVKAHNKGQCRLEIPKAQVCDVNLGRKYMLVLTNSVTANICRLGWS